MENIKRNLGLPREDGGPADKGKKHLMKTGGQRKYITLTEIIYVTNNIG